MKIIDQLVHSVWVVKYDQIPGPLLLLSKNLIELKAIFQFNEIGVSENNYIGAKFGLFVDETGEHPIPELVIEDRRILLTIQGSSSSAAHVMDKLRMFISTLANRIDAMFLEPVVKAQETELVVNLDFPASRLFASEINQYISDVVTPSINSDLATAVVKPVVLTFAVSFHPVNDTLDDYKIGLSRKEFIIGPRQGYPLSEQVYYSKAPVDTDTHISLLQQLENLMKQKNTN